MHDQSDCTLVEKGDGNETLENLCLRVYPRKELYDLPLHTAV